MIRFSNCKIIITDQTYFNKKIEFIDRYIYPVKMLNQTVEKPINFKEIVITQIENIKSIKELTYHKKISYPITSTTIMIIIVYILILYIWLKKRNSTKIVITQKKIQENSKTKGGGVTYPVCNPNYDPNLIRNVDEIINKYIV